MKKALITLSFFVVGGVSIGLYTAGFSAVVGRRSRIRAAQGN